MWVIVLRNLDAVSWLCPCLRATQALAGQRPMFVGLWVRVYPNSVSHNSDRTALHTYYGIENVSSN
jgi:hypothetical protein